MDFVVRFRTFTQLWCALVDLKGVREFDRVVPEKDPVLVRVVSHVAT